LYLLIFSMFANYTPKFPKYSNVDICDYVFYRFKQGSKENEKHGIEDSFHACAIFEYWVSIVCVEKNVSMLRWLMKTFPHKTYFSEYIISRIATYLQFEEGNEVMNNMCIAVCIAKEFGISHISVGGRVGMPKSTAVPKINATLCRTQIILVARRDLFDPSIQQPKYTE